MLDGDVGQGGIAPEGRLVMEHSIIYRREGFYSGFPQLDHLADGRLAVGLGVSPFKDHAVVGEWTVLVSTDGGRTWAESADPTVPQSWPGETPRERSDRFAGVLADGTYMCAGTTGWDVWQAERRSEAEQQGLIVHPHYSDRDKIMVRHNSLFVQHSEDGGQTWSRREWPVPGFRHIIAFSRPAQLSDGAVLVPVYGADTAGASHGYVWRSADGKSGWRLVPMGVQPAGLGANETAFVEVSPGRVLAHSRNATGYLSETWSDDGGLTWSQPLLTDIWAPHSPPHLLKLRDGRVLCAYGYRRAPMGVRAVLSEDGGVTWDTEGTVVLRDDGGTPSLQQTAPDDADLESLRLSGSAFQAKVQEVVSGRAYPTQRARSDVGYPISTQLSDGSVLTVYYITPEDGVTHSAATRWEP